MSGLAPGYLPKSMFTIIWVPIRLYHESLYESPMIWEKYFGPTSTHWLYIKACMLHEVVQSGKIPVACSSCMRTWMASDMLCQKITPLPRGSHYTANMDLWTQNHVWYGFWALIPYWQSKWTLWVMYGLISQIFRRKGASPSHARACYWKAPGRA